LVRAADDAGRLRRLSAEFTNLVNDRVPNVDLVLTLLDIVGTDRQDAERREGLLKRIANLKNAVEKPQSNADLVIVAACLTRQPLHSIREELFKAPSRS
jgi:hypothetical protein